jgi:predicted dehydrogenase
MGSSPSEIQAEVSSELAAARIPAVVIGTGRIASLLEDDPRREKPATHAGALQATGRCQIVGGFDTDEERRKLFAQRWNTKEYSDPREMIRRETPAIVVIATHPDSHEGYLRLAQEMSVPVVVCEKPVAHTMQSARRMVRLEDSGSLRVVVNHERRFSRDYQLVRKAVDEKRFGTLLSISGILNFGGSQRLDRVFHHDGTHLIDAINFITGDTLDLVGRSGTLRRTTGTVYLRGRLHRAAVPVLLETGAQRRFLQFQFRLSFTDGEIEVGNGIFAWRDSRESPFYSGYRSLRDMHRCVPEPTGYFRAMMDHAVDLVADPLAPSLSPARAGYEALRIIHQAQFPRGWF